MQYRLIMNGVAMGRAGTYEQCEQHKALWDNDRACVRDANGRMTCTNVKVNIYDDFRIIPADSPEFV